MYGANSQLYLPIIKDISETTWAYLAGIIDGEGNVSIYRNSSKSKYHYKDGWRRAYAITVTNNSIDLLNEIHKKVPLGKVYGPYYYKGHSKKDEYHLYTCFIHYDANSIRVMLPKLMPYLILKKELAEIMQRSLKIGEEMKRGDERKEMLNQIDREFGLAFLKTKGNKPYTNNKEYWRKRREAAGRPPPISLLDDAQTVGKEEKKE